MAGWIVEDFQALSGQNVEVNEAFGSPMAVVGYIHINGVIVPGPPAARMIGIQHH
jgi:hypothetical protein